MMVLLTVMMAMLTVMVVLTVMMVCRTSKGTTTHARPILLTRLCRSGRRRKVVGAVE